MHLRVPVELFETVVPIGSDSLRSTKPHSQRYHIAGSGIRITQSGDHLCPEFTSEYANGITCHAVTRPAQAAI